jgi:hypothetical protein
MRRMEVLMEEHKVDHFSSHLRAYSPDKTSSTLTKDIRNAQDGESVPEMKE